MRGTGPCAAPAIGGYFGGQVMDSINDDVVDPGGEVTDVLSPW